jgi:hypothetical protein
MKSEHVRATYDHEQLYCRHYYISLAQGRLQKQTVKFKLRKKNENIVNGVFK